MATTRIPSSSPYANVIGFSAAVRAGDLIVVSGMTAVDSNGVIVGGEDPYAQAVEALRKVREPIEAAGACVDQIIRTRMFLTQVEHYEAVGRAHGELFNGIRPAATMIVTRLLDPRMLVEIEALAYVGEAGRLHVP